MKVNFDFITILIFSFSLPPGNFLFIFLPKDLAFLVSKLIVFFLVLYWLYRILKYYEHGNNILIPAYAIFLIFPIFSYIVVGLFHSEFSSAIVGIFRFLSLFIVIIFIKILIENCYEILDRNYYYFSIFAAVSILLSLVLCIFVPEGLFKFSNPDGREAVFYLLSSSNAIYKFGDITYARMSFFFDEPGTYGLFAFISIVYMCLTKKPLFAIILMFLSGFLTFSLGFILSIFLFFILIFTKYITIRRFAYFSLAILIFSVAIYYSPISSVVNSMFINRLDSVLSGGAGNTRLEVTSVAWSYFSENPFFGVGFNDNSKYDFFGANILFFLALGGLVAIFCYLPLIYLSIHLFLIGSSAAAISLLLIYLQRPDFLMPYSVVFTSFCIFLSSTFKFRHR